jgi:hypothetical protein
MLGKEAKILQDLAHKEGFPRLIEISQKNTYSYLIMNFLGPNIEQLKRKMGAALSLKTVLMIGV